MFKNSKIPFALLREVTATHIELWCEYAIATKGMVALRISRSLAKKINAYFEANLDKNPIPKDLPLSKVVAHLETIIYRLFYRNFLIPRLKSKATEGFDALRKWVKDKMAELGVSALCDDPTVLLRPPNSVDDLLFNKIFPIKDVACVTSSLESRVCWQNRTKKNKQFFDKMSLKEVDNLCQIHFTTKI